MFEKGGGPLVRPVESVAPVAPVEVAPQVADVFSSLPPVYQARVFLEGDKIKVAQKAQVISEGREAGVAEYQQAILMLGLRGETEIVAILEKSIEHSNNTKVKSKKERLIEATKEILHRCENQQQALLILGLNVDSEKWNLIQLLLVSSPAFAVLQSAFSLTEIQVLVKSTIAFYELTKVITSLQEKATSANEVTTRINDAALNIKNILQDSSDIELLFQSYPEIIAEVLEGKIQDEQLQVFKGLNVEAQQALLKNAVLENHLPFMNEQSSSRIDFLEQVLGDSYTEFLSCVSNSSLFFRMPTQERVGSIGITRDEQEIQFEDQFLAVVASLKNIFGDSIPWRNIFIPAKFGKLIDLNDFDLWNVSSQMLDRYSDFFGNNITQQLVCNNSFLFKTGSLERNGIDQQPEINPVLKWLFVEFGEQEFYKLSKAKLHSISIDTLNLADLIHIKEHYGTELLRPFLLVPKSLGELRSIDEVFSIPAIAESLVTQPPTARRVILESLVLLLQNKSSVSDDLMRLEKFLKTGIQTVTESREISLDEFHHLQVLSSENPEAFAVLLSTRLGEEYKRYPRYFDWIFSYPPDMWQNLLNSIHQFPADYGRNSYDPDSNEHTYTEEYLNAVKESLKVYENVFGQDGFRSIMTSDKSGQDVRIRLLNQAEKMVIQNGILTLPLEERVWFLINGLANQALNATSSAELDNLKQNLGLRLEKVFDASPELRPLSPYIIKELQAAQNAGKNVDHLLHILSHRLQQPHLSLEDKVWIIHSRIFGDQMVLDTADPLQNSLSRRGRIERTRHRLQQIVDQSQDEEIISYADERNRAFAQNYNPGDAFDEEVLALAKHMLYLQDTILGFRASEFLGSESYSWEDLTRLALNMMQLNPDRARSRMTLTEQYKWLNDQVLSKFGASEDKADRVTHLFRKADLNNETGAFGISHTLAQLYEGGEHSSPGGKEHQLIWVGVPTTAELAALIPTQDAEFVAAAKKYYALQDFYVPLLDVKTGEIVFSPEEYDELRTLLAESGELIRPSDSESVSKLVVKILTEYADANADAAHDLAHIEQLLGVHLDAVCDEILTHDDTTQWLEKHSLTTDEYRNLVKIAVAAHDLARSDSDEASHAGAGAAALEELVGMGMKPTHLELVTTAIKQHSLPREQRWSDDPLTQALYDIDKADTSPERGADQDYVKMILPTIVTNYTRGILTNLLADIA